MVLADVHGQQPPQIVAPGSCTSAPNNVAAQRIVEDWKAAYNNGDAAKVAALYADDAYYLTQHFVTGVVHGRADIQAYIQRGVDAHYHLDSIRIYSIGCSGDMIYVITRYDATNAGQKVFGVNLVVLRNTGGRWLIVAHEAAVPDPATAIQRLDTSSPQ